MGIRSDFYFLLIFTLVSIIKQPIQLSMFRLITINIQLLINKSRIKTFSTICLIILRP